MSSILSPVKCPQVACYHARVHVEVHDQVVTLEVDLPDWVSDQEVLAGLVGVHGGIGAAIAALGRAGRARRRSMGEFFREGGGVLTYAGG